MGKGKRDRDRKPPKGQRFAGVATNAPIPHTAGPSTPAPYRGRALTQALHANLFLLNYVAFVADGGFDVPVEYFAPRAEDETDEEYQKRRTATRTLVEAQAAAGSWKDLCAEELRQVKPSDAGKVAIHILGQGFDWCRESGFDPTANGYRDGATPLLDALCPTEHRQTAGMVLDTFWRQIALKQPPSIEETAARHPIATIHVAAAMTAWLFSEPACVPDRTATQMKLIEQGEKLVNSTGR